ncbi:hypothetical protein [Capnocytophaga gingivalis]|jgi:hypothetical protein
MRKIILLLVATTFSLIGCSKGEDTLAKSDLKATMSAQLDPVLDGSLYPSAVYSMAQIKSVDKNALTYFNLSIESEVEFNGKIRVTNDKFIHETLIEKKFQKGMNNISVNLLWKYDDFIKFQNPGITHFSFQLLDREGKLVTNTDVEVPYRSVSECVFALKNGNQVLDFRAFFASYVNEDSKLIDPFLSETLREHNETYKAKPNVQLSSGWAGYQLGAEYADLQVIAIVAQLMRKGMNYSNITDTSNSSTKVYSQNVRFINETLAVKNANCVDGSVLLASILEKIGIRCFLVAIPGHMYLAYSRTGKTEATSADIQYVETTLIGSGSLEKVFGGKNDQDQKFIGIKAARELGLKPIQ